MVFRTNRTECSYEFNSVTSVQTKAIKKNNKYIVNGQKRFITNACVADYVNSSC